VPTTRVPSGSVTSMSRSSGRPELPGRTCVGLGHQRLDVVQHGEQEPLAERAGGQLAAAPLGLPAALQGLPGQPVAQQPVADRPAAQPVQLDRQRVGRPVLAGEQRQPDPLAQEPLHRVLQEGDQVVQGDQPAVVTGRGQRGGQERRRRRRRTGRGQRPGQLGPVEAERPRQAQRRGGEVARVEGLQRVPDEDLLAARRPGAGGDRVEQLAQRHRGRATGPGALVGAGVHDDQVLGGRADRVEQQLAVLAARVALADQGIAGQQVVAVGHAGPRERAVVQPEQAHHPVRDRAHRHQGGHGEAAGAEVRPAGPPAQPLVEQPAHVGRSEPDRAGVRAGRASRVGQLAAGLRGLPGVGLRWCR
jgi:hypothetical protein